VFHYTSLFESQRDMIAPQRVFFINLFFVQYRGMNNNLIEKITFDPFHYLSNLSSLDLSHNKLKEIRFFFPKNITHLFMDHNLIENIDFGAFRDLNKLRTLKLYSNKIKSINFALPKSLNYIDLSDNQIETFDPEQFNPLPCLEFLSIRKNPLKEIIKINNCATYVLKSSVPIPEDRSKGVFQDEPASSCFIV
jgi:Leucine-rich repeat (LRR) protein